LGSSHELNAILIFTRKFARTVSAEGWVAVFQDEEGSLSETVRVPLFAWALVREIDKKTVSTQVTGLHIDDEGQICETCWSEGFLRYERLDTTERPQSSGK
jgi:hypothetical protein